MQITTAIGGNVELAFILPILPRQLIDGSAWEDARLVPLALIKQIFQESFISLGTQRKIPTKSA
jgi:hypothetical protein